MFADLERYKALERDLLTSSITNQFSGLVYVPAITYNTGGFQQTLQTAGAVTINIDNATCTLQSTDYPAYFIPGYVADTAAITNKFNSISLSSPSTSVLELFDKEVLTTHINTQYWYPNNLPASSWGRPRQNPFNISYLFHVGSSKTFVAINNYYQYSDSGLLLVNLLEVYQQVAQTFNNNVNVRVTGSSMTYQQYTPATVSGLQGLSKNTIINYIKRFPDRIT
ncbi:MAG: hypothetical protein RMZ43_002955 [Nostoc sp. CmiVER01]|uniref:hypothetical protein n=1 Tax=Nostoc sp. CmiVER01 TaxID=3075384 RepID=UPI002AD2787E|nr:hypothetical protein [Nostoc sp. CmiVER01]MDZ8124752.1 hypothetical protein [Nostoc sp. CmiVER01]